MSEAVMKSNTKQKKLRFKRAYFAFPYMLINAVFVVVPLAILIGRAFMRDGSFSFGNFIEFFTDSRLPATLGRSFLIAGLTAIFCLILAYPLAIILSNSKINKTAILVLLFVLPMWINSLLRTYAIRSVFELLRINGSYTRAVIAMVYDFFPFMLLPIYTVLVNMDRAYGEASQDLGAGNLKTFLKVTLPLSVSGIMSGILMVFIPALSTFAISDIVTEPKLFIFGKFIDEVFETSSESLHNLGAAYSFIFLAFILVTMLAANKLTGKNETGAGVL